MMASASPFVKLPGLPARAATAGRRWRLARVGVAVLAVLAVAVALAGFHAQRNTERAPAPAAAVWAVAVVVIPVADIGLALASAGEVVLHLLYLGVMAGAALAYLAAARQAGG